MKQVFRASLLLMSLLMIVAGAQSQGRRRQEPRYAEEEKAEKIRRISRRLMWVSSQSDLTQENRILNEAVSSLLERSQQVAAGSYLFERLESAMEDLLEASEKIVESRTPRPERGRETVDEVRGRTARELERSYFRIQQGDYFARQARDGNPSEYLMTARRIYQLARAEYDRGEYRRARSLADASQHVIEALESLAQAAVPVPDPPVL
jgi:hypothetical protein